MSKLSYAEIREIQDEIRPMGNHMAMAYALGVYEVLVADVMATLPERVQKEFVHNLETLKNRVDQLTCQP